METFAREPVSAENGAESFRALKCRMDELRRPSDPPVELPSATMADGHPPELGAAAAVMRSTADRFDAILSDESLLSRD